MGRIVSVLLLALAVVGAAHAAGEAKACPVCKKVFDDQLSYIRHVRSHLGSKETATATVNDAAEASPRIPAKDIPLLTLRGGSRSTALLGAIQTGSTMPVRSTIPTFSCPYCGKQVVSHLGMLLHLQWHKGGKARPVAPVVVEEAPAEEAPAPAAPVVEEAPVVEATPPADESKAEVKAEPATESSDDDVLDVLDE